MTTYKDLLKQRDSLEQQIVEARQREAADAIARARALVTEFGLTVSDVFPAGKKGRRSSSAGSKVAAKYRDPQTGATWTGRGKPPRWIADKNRDQYLIK